MKQLLAFCLLLCCLTAPSQSPTPDGWDNFARVKFEAKYIKAQNTYYSVPIFDQRILALKGTLITLTGYYMPMDLPKNELIISRNPYSSCFFCGGAGPESIAEAIFKTKLPKLKPDQVITVRGRLKLNSNDFEHTNFILEDAVLVEKTNN